MDIRVGVDLVEIDRMQHAIETNERFLQLLEGFGFFELAPDEDPEADPEAEPAAGDGTVH